MAPERLFEQFQQSLKSAYSLLGIWRRVGLDWLRRPLSLPLNLGFRARIKSYLAAGRRKCAVFARET